jgi:zinc transport system substrate-binding protein
MRIILIPVSVVVAAAVVIALTSSGDKSTPTGHPKTIAAAFYPVAFAAQQIGGPAVQVENLTPPGAEPHDIEPTPQDVQDLQSADLDLLMGHDFQPQLERAADGSSGSVIKLLDTPGLDLRPADPHVWLDPLRFILVVKRIGQAMGDEPATRPLIDRLHALDRSYRAGLANCERHDIVTSHEAFGYLAQRYGLNQVAILGLSPEAEPTPAGLQRALDAVRQTDATTVFSETLLSPKLAETVARETGTTTEVLNPIEGLTPDQQQSGEDYFSLMRENLAALRKALGCR